MPTKARDGQGISTRSWVRSRLTSAVVRQHSLLATAGIVCVLSSCTISSGPENGPKSAEREGKAASTEQAFLSRMSTESVRIRVSGTGRSVIGRLKIPMELDMEAVGSDTHTSIEARFGETEHSYEEISLAEGTFTSQNNGPWVRQKDSTNEGDEDLSSFVRSIKSVEDIGTETMEGEELHHLRPPRNVTLDAAALGLAHESVAEARGRVDFYVRDDGTPVIMSMNARWRQAVGGKTVPGRIRFSFRFSWDDDQVSISAPSDAWRETHSRRFGYSVATPTDWELSGKRHFDLFRGPNGELVVVTSRKKPRGMTLNQFTGFLIRFYSENELKDRPTGNEPVLLKDSLPGRLLTYRRGNSSRVALVAVSVSSSRSFEIVLLSASSTLHEDRGTLLDLLTTFSPTDPASSELDVLAG